MGGDFIGRDAKGRHQARGARGRKSWDDPANRDAFLIHLSATANVARSAAAAGLNVTGAYRMRQRDPLFREQWRLALCDGVARVEALLIEGAAATAEVPRLPDGEIDRLALKHYDPASALAVLKFHGPTARGEATGRGRPVPRDADALRAIILQRIAEARAIADGAREAPMPDDADALKGKGVSEGARGDERG